jgi:ribonuclease HI
VSELTDLTLTTDGAALNNQYEDKREAAVGYVIQQGEDTLVEKGEYLGQGPDFTNNVAEYQAIKLGADRIADSWDPETVELQIQSDSELIVKQLTGQYDVNDKKMEQNHAEVTEILSAFADWEIKHISETQGNTVGIADDIAGEAINSN